MESNLGIIKQQASYLYAANYSVLGVIITSASGVVRFSDYISISFESPCRNTQTAVRFNVKACMPSNSFFVCSSD